jgi:hypothetical protein
MDTSVITLSCGATIRRRPRGRSRYGPHMIMVEAYRLQRDTDIRAREVACGDEDHPVITFREWITAYEWETEERS